MEKKKKAQVLWGLLLLLFGGAAVSGGSSGNGSGNGSDTPTDDPADDSTGDETSDETGEEDGTDGSDPFVPPDPDPGDDGSGTGSPTEGPFIPPDERNNDSGSAPDLDDKKDQIIGGEPDPAPDDGGSVTLDVLLPDGSVVATTTLTATALANAGIDYASDNAVKFTVLASAGLLGPPFMLQHGISAADVPSVHVPRTERFEDIIPKWDSSGTVDVQIALPDGRTVAKIGVAVSALTAAGLILVDGPLPIGDAAAAGIIGPGFLLKHNINAPDVPEITVPKKPKFNDILPNWSPDTGGDDGSDGSDDVSEPDPVDDYQPPGTTDPPEPEPTPEPGDGPHDDVTPGWDDDLDGTPDDEEDSSSGGGGGGFHGGPRIR